MRDLVVPNAISEEAVMRRFNRDNIRSELNLGNGKIIGAITSLVGYEGITISLERFGIFQISSASSSGDGESNEARGISSRT